MASAGTSCRARFITASALADYVAMLEAEAHQAVTLLVMLRDLNVVEHGYGAVLEVVSGIPMIEVAERCGLD